MLYFCWEKKPSRPAEYINRENETTDYVWMPHRRKQLGLCEGLLKWLQGTSNRPNTLQSLHWLGSCRSVQWSPTGDNCARVNHAGNRESWSSCAGFELACPHPLRWVRSNKKSFVLFFYWMEITDTMGFPQGDLPTGCWSSFELTWTLLLTSTARSFMLHVGSKSYFVRTGLKFSFSLASKNHEMQQWMLSETWSPAMSGPVAAVRTSLDNFPNKSEWFFYLHDIRNKSGLIVCERW